MVAASNTSTSVMPSTSRAPFSYRYADDSVLSSRCRRFQIKEGKDTDKD